MPKKNRKVPAGHLRIDEGAKTRPDSSGAKHLASIDRLLSAAFELMKREPTIDKPAYEQLRQLRVRIRYAISSADSEVQDAPPKVAPAFFKNRSDENEDPISFTSRMYSKWLGKNIYRSDIKKLDPQLYNALYNLDNPGEKLAKIGLLTKKQLNDLKLNNLNQFDRPSTTLRIAEMPPSERERARLFNLVRRRKQRSSKS